MLRNYISTLAATLLLLLPCVSAQGQWARRSNLPTIYINTYNGAAITSKVDYVYCTLRYVDEDDYMEVYDSTQIRGRGNSTWGLGKKPYRIKFHQKEKFLGKGYAKAKKWTLLANAADKTLIRNAVTSALGEFTSLKFNPAYKFVDVVLNGVFLGNYQISDHVDVRPHRVDITEQDLPLELNSDVSGGYLLEVDGFQDGNCFTTSRYHVPVRIHYPDEEEIAIRQNTYIRNYMRDFETVLASANFDDAELGYRAQVDTASLIDWYLCTEISANIDGFFSTYFYKDQQDDRFFWGPLWDYDIAYGNDYRMWNERGLSTTAYSLMVDIGYGQTKQWVNRMWQDKWFATEVNRRYNELLNEGLVAYLQNTIDSLVTLLDASQQLNYKKWGINTRMYHETVLYSSYDQYVNDLRQFINDHTAWLREEFAHRKPLTPTPEFVAQDFYYRITNANTQKAMDVAGTQVQQYANYEEHSTADWHIRKTSSGHYQLINRSNGLALNDPTPGTATATTNVGTQLNVVTADENNTRQLWNFLPQGTEGYYNLLNVYTQHIANLSGGSSADGTPILSYTNDERNGTSMNRLWFVTATSSPLRDDIDGTRITELDDYALAYNIVGHSLHFGAEVPSALRFTATVFDASGRLVGRFRANESFPMWSRPDGVYIVNWTVGGRTCSVKFSKR